MSAWPSLRSAATARRNRRLHLLGDLPFGHRAAARPDADSTAALVSALRSGSRGANLLPPSGRETIRAANHGHAAAETANESATRYLTRTDF